jgi:hypothetical protein
MEMNEGIVVIVDSGQAGTICQIAGNECWVFLANHDIWVGQMGRIRLPQDEADLAACPLDVDRFEYRESPKPSKRKFEEEC